MADAHDKAEPDTRTLAELSALADGTLDAESAAALRRRIARSPELTRRYEREREAVSALRALRADRAPAGVRVGIAAARQPARRRPRALYGGTLAIGVAAIVAALVLLVPSGAPGSPSVSEAAALALRGPMIAAPAANHGRLNQDVGEVYFPNWSRLGWSAVGQRVDRLDGRRAVTVYYQDGSRQVAYTILEAPALARPGTGKWMQRGVEFRGLRSGSRLIVTWRRAGQTCILSGSGLSPRLLSTLAVSA